MDPEEKPNTVPAERIRALGRRIQQKRVAERLTLERAAEQSGVSAATLSRLERQADMKATKRFITPDTRTLMALSQWLGGLPETMIVAPSTAPTHRSIVVEGEVIGQVGENTPETVEVFLRADPKLSPEAAAMLAEMFRLAYQQYSRLSEGQQSSRLEEGPSSNFLPSPDDEESNP